MTKIIRKTGTGFTRILAVSALRTAGTKWRSPASDRAG
jgi:hypothetical protein